MAKQRNPAAPRRILITTEEQRTFREGVFSALRAAGGTFNGSMRAFANQCAQKHGDARPFERSGGNTKRIERRLKHLVEEGLIRCTWGQSGNYACVTAIALVAERVEPPRITHVSAAARERRRYEILAILAQHDGRVESIAELTRLACAQPGSPHRRFMVAHDVHVLAQQGSLRVSRMRSQAGITSGVTLTPRGRRALEQWRQRVRVPDTAARAAGASAAASAAAGANTRGPKLGPLAAAILRVLAQEPTAAHGHEQIRDRIVGVRFPAACTTPQQHANEVGHTCRNLRTGGYVERTTAPRKEAPKFRITAKGLAWVTEPTSGASEHAAAAPAAPASALIEAPTAPAADAAATTPPGDAAPAPAVSDASATIPASVRELDREIAAVEREGFDLTEHMKALGRRHTDIEARRRRLLDAREKLAAAYGVDAPPLPAALPDRTT